MVIIYSTKFIIQHKFGVACVPFLNSKILRESPTITNIFDHSVYTINYTAFLK